MAVCPSQAGERTAQAHLTLTSRQTSPTDDRVQLFAEDRPSALGQKLKAQQFPALSSHVSHVTLRILPLTLATLHFAQAYVLHQRASAAASLARRGQTPLLLSAVRHAVATCGHEHARLLGAADGGRGFGNIREVRQLGDVVQQAARLGVVGVAVGVAVLFLDVPPKFPALPRLQDFRLHLRKEPRGNPGQSWMRDKDIMC